MMFLSDAWNNTVVNFQIININQEISKKVKKTLLL